MNTEDNSLSSNIISIADSAFKNSNETMKNKNEQLEDVNSSEFLQDKRSGVEQGQERVFSFQGVRSMKKANSIIAT